MANADSRRIGIPKSLVLSGIGVSLLAFGVIRGSTLKPVQHSTAYYYFFWTVGTGEPPKDFARVGVRVDKITKSVKAKEGFSITARFYVEEVHGVFEKDILEQRLLETLRAQCSISGMSVEPKEAIRIAPDLTATWSVRAEEAGSGVCVIRAHMVDDAPTTAPPIQADMGIPIQTEIRPKLGPLSVTFKITAEGRPFSSADVLAWGAGIVGIIGGVMGWVTFMRNERERKYMREMANRRVAVAQTTYEVPAQILNIGPRKR